MTNEHLQAACDFLEIEVGQVLSWKIYPEDDQIVLVVDYGIKGCPKISLSLSSMEHKAPALEKEKKNITPDRKPADDLDTLDIADLRAMAKEMGIKSYWNMRRDTITNKLREKLF